MTPSPEKLARLPEIAPEGAFRQSLEQVDRLPTLPEVITRIMSMVDDPRISAARIGEVVGQDQSMVATILKVVNSPFYGLRSQVTSIQHAVVLLGFRSVRNMALSAVLVRTFGESSRDHRFDRTRLWRHTVATAVGARLLGEMLRTCDPEEAFLAGLIHDMGIVILDQYFHEEFRAVMDLVLTGGKSICEAEREVFGHDHSMVGMFLARKWNFPAPVVEAIGCHHEPILAQKEPVLAAVVHLADFLSRSHTLDPGADDSGTAVGEESAEPVSIQIWETEQLDPAALELSKVGPEELSTFRRLFEGEWAKAQVFLNLQS
jgi:putative nucleotidyltransferase with HDIG domain